MNFQLSSLPLSIDEGARGPQIGRETCQRCRFGVEGKNLLIIGTLDECQQHCPTFSNASIQADVLVN